MENYIVPANQLLLKVNKKCEKALAKAGAFLCFLRLFHRYFTKSYSWISQSWSKVNVVKETKQKSKQSGKLSFNGGN